MSAARHDRCTSMSTSQGDAMASKLATTTVSAFALTLALMRTVVAEAQR